jgi:nitrite reductase (NO-forming)
MKKIKYFMFATIAATSFLSSCGGEKKEEAPKEETVETAPVEAAVDAGNLEARIAAGKVAYEKICQVCHQADGKGLPAAFPPLAQSDYLEADLNRAIDGVVNGLSGEITVNGEKYNSVMPAAALTDEEIADVFTYVLNSFGNKGGEVNAEQVKALRKEVK